MGCSSSRSQSYASQAPAISGKRLSMNLGDDAPEQTAGPNLLSSSEARAGKSVSEADHSMGSVTDSDDITGLLEKIAPRKQNRRGSVVIGSTTDQNLADSFKDKAVCSMGSSTESLSIAFTCRKGLKPTAPNQDSYCIFTTPDFALYGVFDGHGGDGHHVSNYVKNTLPKILFQDASFSEPEQRKDLFTRAFINAQAMVEKASNSGSFNANLAGTTVTLVLHDVLTSSLLVAQVGDSSCCLGRWNSDDASRVVSAEKLVEDHKPNDPEEKRRIESSGGCVVFDGYVTHRVYAKGKKSPGLAMSRALGDVLAHKEAGIIAEPTVREVQLTDEDQMLLLCSDGVWEFIQPLEAVEIVNKGSDLQAGVNNLAKEAWDRWMKEEDGACVDDITAICVTMKGVCYQSERDSQAEDCV